MVRLYPLVRGPLTVPKARLPQHPGAAPEFSVASPVFATRLEQFRHEKSQELEQLRHQINSTFSRVSKIHEREFDVLPAAFLKLHQAYGASSGLASALQRYPSLDAMDDEGFAAFVANCRLPEFRKKELLTTKDRTDYYARWIFWVNLADAKSLLSEFHNYLMMNRIFMTDSLQTQFGEIDRLMRSVLTALEVDRDFPNQDLQNGMRSDLGKIEPLLQPLETAIKERLRYGQA